MLVRGGATRLIGMSPLGLLLVACVEIDLGGGGAPGDSGLVNTSDHDGDGYEHPGAGGGDCDDLKATVYPGADELCDGLDNDCDGAVDEDAADADAWYVDGDGDGFGDGGGDPVVSCQALWGYVTNGDDCDDADAGSNPGAGETCDGADDDCDGYVDESPEDGTVWYQDGDGDGYGGSISAVSCGSLGGFLTTGGDCDDGDADINPDGAEVCDGVDNDCDGYVDDAAADATPWHLDLDGDGYGAPDYAVNSCEQPSRYVADASDCDDGDADINPDAEETCDGVDDDCDGAVDDAATDVAVWYADSDGDGYGDAASTLSACDQPSGYVDDDSDCDDLAADVSPGADELCGDALDNDCDSTVDEDGAVDAPTWYADSDGDGYGNAAITDVACEAPTRFVADDSDCDDLYDDTWPGAEETCDGDDQDCDGAVDEDATDADAWYVDVDADGFGDPDTETSSCEVLSGYVAVGEDCDDADPSAWPGAEELCDGVQNDCDATWSSDDGIATFFSAGGGLTDLSADLAGTSAAPAAWTLSEDGEVAFCGDWYVELSVAADVRLYGGDPAVGAALLGGGLVTPIAVAADGLSVLVEDLTIQGGAATLAFTPGSDLGLSGALAGGGLHCSGDVELSLSGVIFSDNAAGFGGGLLLQDGCAAIASDLQLVDNAATYGGGGIALYDASLSLDGASFELNSAGAAGGGIYTYASAIDAADVDFIDNTPDDTYDLQGLDADSWGLGASFVCDGVTCD